MQEELNTYLVLLGDRPVATVTYAFGLLFSVQLTTTVRSEVIHTMLELPACEANLNRLASNTTHAAHITNIQPIRTNG